MGVLLSGLGGLCGLAAFVCSIIILIAAFKDETVKGILCLCVPFYMFYYALAVFKHEKKGLIVGMALGGGVLGFLLQLAGAAAAS